MTKSIKREVKRPLDSKNPRDREIFRGKLIGKLKSSTHVKTFSQIQFDELIENLTSIKYFCTTQLDRKTRQKKVDDAAAAAQELVLRIETLDRTEKLIFDDEMQHTRPLNEVLEIIKSFKLKADKLANIMPTKKYNKSIQLRRSLNGQIFYDILNRFSIPLTPSNEIPSKKESSTPNGADNANTIYLPDLSINATSAMLCAMLTLLDGEEEDLYWQQTLTMIDSANSAKDFKENLERQVASDKLREKFNNLITDIINSPPTE